MYNGLGPFERSGIRVVYLHECINGVTQLASRGETGTSERRPTVLKEDKRAIFSAAAHAQRAGDFLNSLQPQQQAEEESAAA